MSPRHSRRAGDSVLGRRSFLTGTAAVTGLLFAGFSAPVRAETVLPAFPEGLSLRKAQFRNWDEAIVTEDLWTVAIGSADDAVRVAEWARINSYTLRPHGFRHTWSPLVVDSGTPSSARVLLLDMTTLNSMAMVDDTVVDVEAGASMQDLLAYLHAHGRAVLSAPAPGDVTVGGVLAVGGHGSAVASAAEQGNRSLPFGSVSDLVETISAVVFDSRTGTYIERTFTRSEPECSSLLVHLGRTLVTRVRLSTVPTHNLRCRTFTDIPIEELFAAPNAAGPRSLTAMLDDAGRVGVIWYTFTDRPWIQQWSVSPTRPAESRPTAGPFNFPFADNLPDPIPQMLGRIIEGHTELAPAFGDAVIAATDAGLTLTGARDMWGPARDFIHFVRPTTLRVTAASHAVITRRDNVQHVVHEFTEVISTMLDEYATRGEYPINSCVEIRVTGVDSRYPVDKAPALSPATPVPGRADFDTAVWLDTLTLPGTPGHADFYADLEQRFFRPFPAELGIVRPEWAKRWGHGDGGAWTDPHALSHEIPDVYPQWSIAANTLAALDPHNLFTTSLTRRLGL
jgi:FAD/FMN-containing dehydrogenase